MTNLFQVSPFATAIGARVEQATRRELSEPDWQLNMSILDRVKVEQYAAKDFLRAIKKRLQSTKSIEHEINLALVLLESASRNCGVRIRTMIAKKDFCRDVLYSVISVKRGKTSYSPQVEDKVLLIIESIATEMVESGQSIDSHGMVAIVELKNELTAKGVSFPTERGLRDDQVISAKKVTMGSVSYTGVTVPVNYNVDESSVSQFTKNVSNNYTKKFSANQSTLEQSTSFNIDKYNKEIDIVEGNIKLLNEMLIESSNTSASDESNEIFSQLASQIKEMQIRLQSLIPNVPDNQEEFMLKLIDVNDRILETLKNFDDFKSGKQPKIEPQPTPKYQLQSPKNSSNPGPILNTKIPPENSEISDLINFDELSETKMPEQKEDFFGLDNINFGNPVNLQEPVNFNLQHDNFDSLNTVNTDKNQGYGFSDVSKIEPAGFSDISNVQFNNNQSNQIDNTNLLGYQEPLNSVPSVNPWLTNNQSLYQNFGKLNIDSGNQINNVNSTKVSNPVNDPFNFTNFTTENDNNDFGDFLTANNSSNFSNKTKPS